MKKTHKTILRYTSPFIVVLFIGGLFEFTLFSKVAYALPYVCSAQNPTVSINEDIVFNAAGDDTGSGIDGFFWSSGGSPASGSGWTYTARFSTPGQKNVYISTSDSFTVYCSVEVIDNNGNPVGDAILSATPSSINIGQSSQLTWTCTQALFSLVRAVHPYSVTPVGGDWYPNDDGIATVSPTQTTTYRLTCYENDDGSVYSEDEATITVGGSTDLSGDIQCRLASGWPSDGPCVVQSSSSTIIDWSTQNTTDCFVSTTGGLEGGTPLWTGLSGSQSTGPLIADTRYYLFCEGELGLQLFDSVLVNVISAVIQVSSNTANNNGPFVDGPLELPATGVQVRLKATCGASGGSGRISPGNINFAGTSYYGNVTFNTSPKTWTLTCYPNPSQSGTPTATDFVTVQLTVPDFTLACNTVSKTVTAGASTIFDTTVTAINGFASLVTVEVTDGLPANASDTPVSITPTAVASVPVSTQATTPAGTSNLTFTATGGGKSHTCISQLIVTDDSDPYLVSLEIAPADSTILVGDSQSYTAEASYSDGSTSAVTGSTTFGSSDENIARASGAADFLGTTDGSVTITGTYIEGIITTADTANLEVGSGAGGGLSASVTCPSGESICTIPHNTSINLTWTSTGADNGCSMSPALIPAVNTESGTASTGNLVATTEYTLTCTGADKGLPPATDTATVIVNPPSESFANTDKDITSINGIANYNGSCNGGTDSIAKTFATADEVSFKVNLCNTGSSSASNIVITDELTNLAVPAGGSWNAEYDGSVIIPVESGTSPNQTLTFTLPGSINAGSTKSLTFDAVVTPPAPITNTIYRFQNIARISTANGSWTSSTPLYLFYAGSRVPSKQEIAP